MLSLLIVGKAFNIVNVLSVQVSKLADVMVRHGVKKGDRVVIYMPMIPQTVCCMLACARIGAIHSLIFGGFASKELSVRIDHAKVIHTWNNKCHCISYSCKPMSKTLLFFPEREIILCDTTASICLQYLTLKCEHSTAFVR